MADKVLIYNRQAGEYFRERFCGTTQNRDEAHRYDRGEAMKIAAALNSSDIEVIDADGHGPSSDKSGDGIESARIIAEVAELRKRRDDLLLANNAEVERRRKAEGKVVDIARIANNHGWNGVTNSKILATFLEDELSELAELRSLYDQQHSLTAAAAEYWRYKNPGNESVSPDLVRMLSWLIKEVEKSCQGLDDARKLAEYIRSACYPHNHQVRFNGDLDLVLEQISNMVAGLIEDRRAARMLVNQLESDLVVADGFREAVEEACVVSWCRYDESDPVGTLKGLIDWEIRVALDPAVSEEAQKLIDTGKELGIQMTREEYCDV